MDLKREINTNVGLEKCDKETLRKLAITLDKATEIIEFDQSLTCQY